MENVLARITNPRQRGFSFAGANLQFVPYTIHHISNFYPPPEINFFILDSPFLPLLNNSIK